MKGEMGAMTYSSNSWLVPKSTPLPLAEVPIRRALREDGCKKWHEEKRCQKHERISVAEVKHVRSNEGECDQNVNTSRGEREERCT